MQQEKQRKINNPRKLLLFLLLLVILPLGIIGVVGIAYNLESKKFSFKINNEDKYFDKSDFETLDSLKGEFSQLAITGGKYYVLYKNKKDEQDKYNPQGYELSFTVNAKLKPSDVYNVGEGIQVYAVIALPGNDKTKVIVDKNVKISADATTANFTSLRLNKALPHRYPFILPIKDVIVYFILRVPFLEQKRIAEEELKQGKALNATEKEKLTEYKEFKFYYNFTKNISFKDSKVV